MVSKPTFVRIKKLECLHFRQEIFCWARALPIFNLVCLLSTVYSVSRAAIVRIYIHNRGIWTPVGHGRVTPYPLSTVVVAVAAEFV
jgi:hypothetical protein